MVKKAQKIVNVVCERPPTSQPRNVKNLLVVCVTAKFRFSHGQTSHFELGGILVKSLSNDELFCIKPLVMCSGILRPPLRKVKTAMI